jgi:predicted transcriptional regulator
MGFRMISIPDFMLVLRVFADRKNEEVSMQEVYYETGITYSHVTKLVKMMRDLGWLTLQKEARENIIMVTPDGIKIANAVSNLFSLMNIDWKQMKKKDRRREHIMTDAEKEQQNNDIKMKSEIIDYEIDKLNEDMEEDLEDETDDAVE